MKVLFLISLCGLCLVCGYSVAAKIDVTKVTEVNIGPDTPYGETP